MYIIKEKTKISHLDEHSAKISVADPEYKKKKNLTIFFSSVLDPKSLDTQREIL